MRKNLYLLFLAFLPVLLTACATQGKEKDLDETLLQYESIIRWSEWDGAVNYLAPEYLKDNPVSSLDMERLRLFRVTQYKIRSGTPINDGNGFIQSVQISLFNKTRAVEKSVMDSQDWRYDAEMDRWLLWSGLPDPTQGR